jgi:hypothetical protein
MRPFPLLVIACFLCWIAPSPIWAQGLHCVPCRHAFGKVPVGTTGTYSIQLTNTSSKVVRIASKSSTGSAFSFGSFHLPVNIQPGGSVPLPIIFTPTARGYTDTELTLKSNAPDSSLNLHFAGTGFYPSAAELELSPGNLNFGNITVGSSTTLQATFNAPGAAVTISSDQSTSSEFAILGMSLPLTIPAGGSLPVTIQFTPNASGKANGKAGFISNAVDSPSVVLLMGTGVAQTSHSVSLSWATGSGNAVGYNVYRGGVNGGPYTEINTALDSSTNYTDNTVTSGTTYYYVATEVNAAGEESAYSNVAQAAVPTP